MVSLDTVTALKLKENRLTVSTKLFVVILCCSYQNTLQRGLRTSVLLDAGPWHGGRFPEDH